jgi:hypothetical protein
MTVTLPTFQFGKFGFLLKALIFFAWLIAKGGNGWVALVWKGGEQVWAFCGGCRVWVPTMECNFSNS